MGDHKLTQRPEKNHNPWRSLQLTNDAVDLCSMFRLQFVQLLDQIRLCIPRRLLQLSQGNEGLIHAGLKHGNLLIFAPAGSGELGFQLIQLAPIVVQLTLLRL